MRRLLLVITLVGWTIPANADDWRAFRGSQSSSVAEANLPTTWDVRSGANVAWSADLPGRGVSGPVIANGRVFLTASSGALGERLHVVCLDEESGKKLWERKFWATGSPGCHPTSANAAPTPATDGERVFAFFSSNDLICLDRDGNLLWARGLTFDFPTAVNDVGMASSPVVVDGTVVVQVETKGESFATGIDALTGESRWKLDRVPSMNWCSPAVLPREKGDLVLIQSPNKLSAVEPKTGKIAWEHSGQCNVIPSPVAEGGKVLLAGAGALVALRAPETSQGVEIVWEQNQLNPANASPFFHMGNIFTLNRAGVLCCGDSETGDVKWQLRLKGSFWATPVAAGNHIFAVNDKGECLVVELGEDKGKIVGENAFNEAVLASPAIADDALFIRSDTKLWKIAQAKS